MKVRVEFKLEDMWVGVFWRKWEFGRAIGIDIWICLVPCFPIHITREWRA